MKLFKQPLQGLLLLLISLPALADDVTYSTIRDAAENSSDLSRQALVTIFGDVVTSPFTSTDTTVIGSLFGILNGVICAIALFWFLTVTLKSIVKAGNAGKVFGSTRTAMAPLMSFVGSSLWYRQRAAGRFRSWSCSGRPPSWGWAAPTC